MLLPALDPADLLFYYSSPSALCSKYTGFHAHLGQASPALASEFSPCCPPARGALLQTRVWLALSGLPINTTFSQSRAFSATPFKMRPYPRLGFPSASSALLILQIGVVTLNIFYFTYLICFLLSLLARQLWEGPSLGLF